MISLLQKQVGQHVQHECNLSKRLSAEQTAQPVLFKYSYQNNLTLLGVFGMDSNVVRKCWFPEIRSVLLGSL